MIGPGVVLTPPRGLVRQRRVAVRHKISGDLNRTGPEIPGMLLDRKIEPNPLLVARGFVRGAVGTDRPSLDGE
jgi:hypothetical protein